MRVGHERYGARNETHTETSFGRKQATVYTVDRHSVDKHPVDGHTVDALRYSSAGFDPQQTCVLDVTLLNTYRFINNVIN
jgi:hypothetical protein